MSQVKEPVTFEGAVCPVPVHPGDTIVLGHGSGGRLMRGLIEGLFLPELDNPVLRAGNDAGRVTPHPEAPLAISTDSHVVWPLFFPGGDIGRLAVCGTVNDVAMLGAEPLYLTASFILEEGLDTGVLHRVVQSMKRAAVEAGVEIIAGDTKVVEKGKADGLYITTTGVGRIYPGVNIGGHRAQPGDVMLLSGPIGDHGIAVLGARGELGFEAKLESDVAPLNHLVRAMLEASPGVHVLRDPTRGGLSSALNEIASQSRVGMMLDEQAIAVREGVKGACELLGLDPLYVANEGKLIAIVAPEAAEKILTAMRAHALGQGAAIIGTVRESNPGLVTMRTVLGTTRIVDMLAGDQLPRIC